MKKKSYKSDNAKVGPAVEQPALNDGDNYVNSKAKAGSMATAKSKASKKAPKSAASANEDIKKKSEGHGC